VKRAFVLFVLVALVVAACGYDGTVVLPTVAVASHDVIGFHGDRKKLGWASNQPELHRERVRGGMTKLWESAPLGEVTLGDGSVRAPHLYASPLYAAALDFETPLRRGTTQVVLAATSNGFVYAIDANAKGLAGTLLWRTQLTYPVAIPKLDGGVALGVLSTPILDMTASPPTLYVAAHEARHGWRVFALDARNGEVRPGWPVDIDDAALAPSNTNGPARFQADVEMSQRGALLLSPAGDRLYVSFGSFAFASVGWIVSIDTRAARIASSFSSAPDLVIHSHGGMWGAGGPTVTDDGHVIVATGNAPPGTADAPHAWGNSLLELSADLRLERAYTPFNYCKLDENNIDLAGSAPLLFPGGTHVIIGGKQGNVYLVDRARMRSGDRRAPCSTDPATDRSQHPPEVQPQFGARGPLNVFGPYTDDFGQIDYAKMRSRPAFFADAAGSSWVYVSGSTKTAADSIVNVPPSMARLRVAMEGAAPSYLAVDAINPSVAFVNPGSPVVTSDGPNEPVVWVVDENAPRSASLLDPTTPGPVLYAFDGVTLELLWRSADGELAVGGKYVTAAVGAGVVIVGTDRIQAFAPR
jgi:outer membrane protein assembly factor BamB